MKHCPLLPLPEFSAKARMKADFPTELGRVKGDALLAVLLEGFGDGVDLYLQPIDFSFRSPIFGPPGVARVIKIITKIIVTKIIVQKSSSSPSYIPQLR